MDDNFLNTIYSRSLYPEITRPSRITAHCAILIDNIFNNDIENNTVSDLLINDISDHLPVCTVSETECRRNLLDKKPTYRRLQTENTIDAFKNDLLSQNW